MILKRLIFALVAIVGGTMVAAAPAAAQTCGIMGTSASGQTTIDYDPFNPSGIGTSTVTLALTRVNPAGGGFTKEVRFYLRSTDPAANGTIITPIALISGNASVTGTGQNIFYNTSAVPPVLTGNPTAANRFLLVDFTGNNAASNTVQVSFQITLPAGADFTATSALAFDVVYTCTGTGNSPPGAGTSPNAIVFPVRVLSALQASWIGQDLDFGEVGDKTNVDVIGNPAYTKTGNVRVASSGPYTISLSSQNQYRLMYPTSPGTPNNRLDYSLLFLGQTALPGSSTVIAANCQKATLAGRSLPIAVTLLEGGNLKTPQPDYRDVLTITIAPQVTLPTAVVCGV